MVPRGTQWSESRLDTGQSGLTPFLIHMLMLYEKQITKTSIK